MYEMATGHHPFEEAKNFLEIREMVQNMMIPPLDETYSDGLRDFICHCLKFDPTERASTIDLLEHPWI